MIHRVRCTFAAAALVAAALALPAGAAAPAAAPVATVPSIADFAKLPDFRRARLSPGGEYVAVLFAEKDQTMLAILRVSDRKLVNGLKLAWGEDVLDYWWTGPQQVVASLGNTDGAFGQPIATGELMAIDTDDNQPRYLIGYRGTQAGLGSRLNKPDTLVYAHASMVDPTPNNPDTILIALQKFEALPDIPRVIYELNTKTGKRSPVAAEPRWGSSMITDSKGRLRYAVASDLGSDGETDIIYRRKESADGWEAMPGQGKGQLVPFFVTSDDRWIYFSATGVAGTKGDTSCLARQPLDGSAPLAVLSCQPGTSLQFIIPAADRREVIASYYEPDQPLLDLADTQHPDASILVGLQDAFGGDLAIPQTASRDGSLWLVHVVSDKNPGQYVLFKRADNSVTQLFDTAPQLPAAAMQPVKTVEYKARDGLTVKGYLTLPKAVAGKLPPLVVTPHGGPFEVRDEWAFDADSQLLASRGYAVLRVNFRGSSSYGSGFAKAGRKQLGKGMIDDLTDGVRHVVKQGLVDGNRVAIAGVSYGGYAALMSGVREPELYKAVVCYAGMSDLKQLKRGTDIAEYKEGKIFLQKFFGDDDAELSAQSPITYIDQLKAPVLIVHGEADKRVPYAQAKLLRDALKKRNHPYEWLVKGDEGHGFIRQANKEAYYEHLLGFLGKHLK